MCDKCNSKPCCCKSEKRINSQGKKGDRGLTGQSAYLYIGYATNVTPGTPDVVTGFSTTTPACWIAVRQSTVPLVITQSIFQGLWKKTCGEPGEPGAPGPAGPDGPVGPSGISVYLYNEVTSIEFPLNISTTNANTNQNLSTGATVTATVAGTYLIIAQISQLFAQQTTDSGVSGNAIMTIMLNGNIPLANTYYSINNHVGSSDFSMTVFCVQISISVGDTIGAYLGLFSPVDSGDILYNYGSKSRITAIKIG